MKNALFIENFTDCLFWRQWLIKTFELGEDQTQRFFLIKVEVLTSIAQNERETTRKRQREGLNAMPIDSVTGKRISRKTGRAVGRPKATYPDNWADVYARWQNKEITARKAMELLGLKPNTFYKLSAEYQSVCDKL